MRRYQQQRGSGLLIVIIVFATLFALVGFALERSGDVFVQVQKQHLETAARDLAEGGVEYAIQQIASSPEGYAGKETLNLEPAGLFSIAVTRLTPADRFEIISTGTANGAGQRPNVVLTLRVVGQRAPENPQRPVTILSWEETP